MYNLHIYNPIRSSNSIFYINQSPLSSDFHIFIGDSRHTKISRRFQDGSSIMLAINEDVFLSIAVIGENHHLNIWFCMVDSFFRMKVNLFSKERIYSQKP